MLCATVRITFLNFITRNVICHYLVGMSAKIGRLISGRKTFVSGAPRAKDSGQVLMFEKSTNKYLTIRPEHYLTGDQFGSYFGYDLAVADFNADG